MSSQPRKEIVKKVLHFGTWNMDVLKGDFMKNIALSVSNLNGKKRQLKLSKAGMKLIQSRFLQESKSVSYSLQEIKTVIKLPDSPACLLFILEDKLTRFLVLAFRFSSEEDATQVMALFDQIQLDQPSSVELRKEESGNWTLREKNTHNSNRHMADIFNERSQANGEVKPNGIVTHIPVLDGSKHRSSAHRRLVEKADKSKHKTSIKSDKGSKKKAPDVVDYKVMKNRGEEYVIETEVSEHPHVPMRTSLTVEPEYAVVKKSSDVNTIYHRENGHDGNHLVYTRGHTTLPSKPVLHATHSNSEATPVAYRMATRTYDTQPRPVSYHADPWSTHRRFMGEYSHYPPSVIRHPAGQGSDHGSIILRADTDSISSKMSKRSRSLSRSEMSVKTTVERPIEATYGRRSVFLRPAPQPYLLVPVHHSSYHDIRL